ncbi:uncharacterized protein LOC125189380 [Salvia hispanica]|uniref:uncharacterized protein LOC125189380 n=1 Tax=Salvia hispanica TaxID=49212 RepID=UPI0020091515|nr:uncharacterized protein LOC125189380 [Salvia hispanica]
MICVTHQLTGSADFWWDTKLKTMPQDRVDGIMWEDFKTEVYNKYIPKSYRKAKAAEFYNLTQGRLSVTEYDRALCDMTRYAPEQTDTDEKLADKFREGLRPEIRMTLAVSGKLTYAEALALALDVEAAMPKERSAGNTMLALPLPRPNHDKRRWDESRTHYDNKRYRPAPNRPPYRGGQTSFNQRSGSQARPPQCNVCAKYHFGECRVPNPIRCFNCGGNGHFSRECPSRNMGIGSRQNNQGFRQQPRAPPTGSGVNWDQPQRQQQPFCPRLPAQARAYAVSQKQFRIEQGNHESGNLAVGGIVEIARTCSNVEIVLGELKLVAHDLQVMAMGDIDVILGMDWLTANFATIRCKERQISLQAPGTEPIVYHGISMSRRTAIISALQATAMMKKGRPAYLVYLHREEEEERRLEDVAVVQNFPDVFPKVFPGPPPDRQLEFTIDLEPGAAPVSKAPYRMTPKELEELKIQLQ